MMVIISQFIYASILNKPEKRLLYIDEGWMLMEHTDSAKFLSGLIRRARKHYLGVTIITQQANDFLSSDFGKVIASQSSLRILLRQDTTSIAKVKSEFKLSEYEKDYLLTAGKGEALIIADTIHTACNVIASRREHPLITTDPTEME